MKFTRDLFKRYLLAGLVVLTIGGTALEGQNAVTTPEEQFGHEFGADYVLPNYSDLYEYWEKLATESDRMSVQDIGYTEEGRPQIMAVITAPENRAHLERYKEISRSLAKAEGVTEEEAYKLAAEGKVVVWIDGGLHATEVLGSAQLMEMVYRLVSYDDAETMRILRDVIILAVQVNPDGMELVSDWYMRESDPLKRSTSGVPVLYQKYAGHDNNRDFYMSALSETTNINRILYREWFPQIVYNHHQTGPTGTIMFAPPFRDPPNHNLDPLIITGLDGVGAAMHARFVKEGKGGTTMRTGAGYSTWWNGGLRTTPYFKNMIGLLTETVGNPTPINIPFKPDRQISHGDLPLPVEPGVWHFRQSVEYSQTANWAVLDYASRNRDHLLSNIWRMGMNSIERGNRDSWTVLPFEVEKAQEELGENTLGGLSDYRRSLQSVDDRDPRGFIIPSSQADFATATKFINTLIKNGVDVHQAGDDFDIGNHSYPSGSYVVKANQAFRPHVMDMFTAQQHPNDFAYPGGPPTPPYDNAGWTLAFQMGVEFDPIFVALDGPFERLEGLQAIADGIFVGQGEDGYLFDHSQNNSFLVLNRLLEKGHEVHWLLDETDTSDLSEGAFYVAQEGFTSESVREFTEGTGVDFLRSSPPKGSTIQLKKPRIALWDQYGGSMTSGWTRKILEDFEFEFSVVFPQDLAKTDLASQFDVIILEDGAIPNVGTSSQGSRRRDLDPSTIPEEYQDRLGSLTAEKGIPEILHFVESGGTVIAIGGSAVLGYYADLPITNHLLEAGRPVTRDEYFTPGSVHSIKIESDSPLTHGLGDELDVMISHSPVFSLEAGYEDLGVKRIGWFDSAEPLRSGWAWGQERMEGGTALVEAEVGLGKMLLFTPKITFRAQSHAAFPLLFNGIYYGSGVRD